MPGEDKNFGGSLVLDFRKWWRHVKTIYTSGQVLFGEAKKNRNVKHGYGRLSTSLEYSLHV